jgi:hypothetical protein
MKGEILGTENRFLLRTDWLVIAIILIAGVKYTFGLENVRDIILYDESEYLFEGVTLLNRGLPEAQYAPLYGIWYFIISLFEPNRISLYFLNYKLMTILPPIFTYVLLRRYSVPIPTGLIFSWFFLISPLNGCWPKVSYFALILTLLTFILISHNRSLLWSSLLASIGALLVSYVRPEYFLSYILLLLLFIFMLIQHYQNLERHHVPGIVVYVIFSVLLLGALGIPVAGDRSMLAFGQHFSLNWVAWSGSNLNPWTNWDEIIALNFGSANNVREALANNPSVFLKHIIYNLRAPFDIYWFPLRMKYKLSIGVATLLIAGLGIANISTIRSNISEYKRLLIIVCLFLIPGFLSLIIIFPREHYLMLFSTLTVLTIVILLSKHHYKPDQINNKRLFLLALFAIVLTPYFPSKSDEKPNLSTIRFINSLRIHEPVDLLEAEGGYNIYLDDNFHRVAQYDKNMNFYHFLKDRNINMIVLSDSLRQDTRFRDDPEWQGFLADPHRSGYLQLTIPKTDSKLIIRDDLLHK